MSGGYRLTESGSRRAVEGGSERITESFYEGAATLSGQTSLSASATKRSLTVGFSASSSLAAKGTYNAHVGAVLSSTSALSARGNAYHVGSVTIQADAVERLTEAGSRRITESGVPRGLVAGGAGSSLGASGTLIAFAPKAFQNRSGTWGLIKPQVRVSGAFLTPRFVYVRKNGLWVRVL